MNCPKCDQVFVGACPCGYQPQLLEAIRKWIIQTCAEPGCAVVIRSLAGEQESTPRCKWHKSGTASHGRQIKIRPEQGAQGDGAEFPRDLFAAIKLQSGIRQAEQNAELAHRKGRVERAHELEELVKALNRQLSDILNKNTIPTDDLTRLLAIL